MVTQNLVNRSMGFNISVGIGLVSTGLACCLGVNYFGSGSDRNDLTREGTIADTRLQQIAHDTHPDAGLYQSLPTSQTTRTITNFYEIDMVVAGRPLTIENRGNDESMHARQRIVEAAKSLHQLCTVGMTNPRIGNPLLTSIRCRTR